MSLAEHDFIRLSAWFVKSRLCEWSLFSLQSAELHFLRLECVVDDPFSRPANKRSRMNSLALCMRFRLLFKCLEPIQRDRVDVEGHRRTIVQRNSHHIRQIRCSVPIIAYIVQSSFRVSQSEESFFQAFEIVLETPKIPVPDSVLGVFMQENLCICFGLKGQITSLRLIRLFHRIFKICLDWKEHDWRWHSHVITIIRCFSLCS